VCVVTVTVKDVMEVIKICIRLMRISIYESMQMIMQITMQIKI